MKQVIISFGLLITAVLLLLWLAQVPQFYRNTVDDMWIVVVCVCFLIIGVFSIKKSLKKTSMLVQQRPSVINYSELSKAGICRREGEMLLLIEQGLSNQQIADRLFISESMVKKHIANIFAKLQVEQRSESVKKAKELSILL